MEKSQEPGLSGEDLHEACAFVIRNPEQTSLIFQNFLRKVELSTGVQVHSDDVPQRLYQNLQMMMEACVETSHALNQQNFLMGAFHLLIPNYLKTNRFVQDLYNQISEEFKSSADDAYLLGFKRKMLKDDYEGKEERYMQNTINNFIKKRFKHLEGAFSINSSQLFDLEDIKNAVSPLVKEFLECDLFEECIDFVERNPEILNFECKAELQEQTIRFLILNQRKNAEQCNLRMVFLIFARFLKDLTRYFFTRTQLLSFHDTVKTYLDGSIQESRIHSRFYIEKFIYEFTIPDNYDEFVVNVPSKENKNYNLFTRLPVSLRDAIRSGTPEAILNSLRALEPSRYAFALRLCSKGGFFWFKFTFTPKDLKDKFPFLFAV